MTRGECSDLWTWVESRAAATPREPFAFDEHDRHIDFAAFRDWGERVAAGLIQSGLSPGDRVAWMLPTRIETLVLTIALARLGCEQVPLIPVYGCREVRFILEESQPQWAIVPGQWKDTDYVELFRDALRESKDPPRLILAAPDLPEADPSLLSSLPRPVALPARRDATPARAAPWIFYTSGTTSQPKGAIHSDATLFASAVGLERPHDFRASDRVSLVFPYAHIGGPILLMSALRVGHALILCETFAPEVVIDTLSRNGVTFAGPGPAFWQAYLRAQREAGGRRIFPELRALIGGGAAKPAHLHVEAHELLSVPIVSGYGLTECPSLAYNRLDDPDEVLATDGRAVEGVEIRIVDGEGIQAPVDRIGEICVRGPMLFHGYLDSKLDIGAFHLDGFLRTGDLGCLDEQGSLRVTGRLKDVIIRKGESLSAKEIEEVLASHPEVEDVTVIGLPDDDRGERCCAVIVCRDPFDPPNLADLVRHCSELGLMKQKHPEQLEILETLPRNSTGKILKAELRARFGTSP